MKAFFGQVRRDMIVRDVRERHPETRAVFEQFEVREACWDCSVAEVAHRSAVDLPELLGALNAAIARARTRSTT